MSCEFWRGRVIDLARGCESDKDAADHMHECPECARLFEEQIALTSLMREPGLEGLDVPPDLESRLLAEFDAARVPRRRYWRIAGTGGAIAAAVGCFALLHSNGPRVKALPARMAPTVNRPAVVTAARAEHTETRRPLRHRPAAKPGDDSAPFVAIPYTLPLDPHEPVTVMRVTMPVTALVAVGLAAAPPDPSAFAQADALVSEDGRIRALRLLSVESYDFSAQRRTNP